VLLAVRDGIVNQLLVVGLLGRGQDEGRVGGGILGLVLVDGGEVARVADDRLVLSVSLPSAHLRALRRGEAWRGTHGAGRLELIERVGHSGCDVCVIPGVVGMFDGV
jgi:hypothetical protein